MTPAMLQHERRMDRQIEIDLNSISQIGITGRLIAVTDIQAQDLKQIVDIKSIF